MPDKRPRFDDLFGRASHDVDYEAEAGEPILPMPEETDDLARTAEKLKALAVVVESGHSLAVRTGFRGASRQERGQFVEGESELTGIELAEMHTAHNAVAIARGNLDCERAQIRRLISSINASMKVLQAHLYDIKAKRRQSKPTKDIVASGPT